MSNKCTAILELFRQGKQQCETVGVLNVPRQTVSKAIKCFKELGHEGDSPGKGRKSTANTLRNRKVIQSRVKRNPRVSMRKIAREAGINREAVSRIAKNELHLKPYKLQKVQQLTEDNRQVQLQKCRQLKRRFAAQRWESILFTDETLFTLQQAQTPKTTESGPPTLPAHRQSSNTDKNLSLSWCGAAFAPAARPISFSLKKASKSNKMCTSVTSLKLWYFRRPSNTSRMDFGRFNMTPHQLTRQS